MTSILTPYFFIALAAFLVGGTCGLMGGCILVSARDVLPPPAAPQAVEGKTYPVPTRTRTITLADVLNVTPKSCYDVPLQVRTVSGEELEIHGCSPQINAQEKAVGFVLRVANAKEGKKP